VLKKLDNIKIAAPAPAAPAAVEAPQNFADLLKLLMQDKFDKLAPAAEPAVPAAPAEPAAPAAEPAAPAAEPAVPAPAAEPAVPAPAAEPAVPAPAAPAAPAASIKAPSSTHTLNFDMFNQSIHDEKEPQTKPTPEQFQNIFKILGIENDEKTKQDIENLCKKIDFKGDVDKVSEKTLNDIEKLIKSIEIENLDKDDTKTVSNCAALVYMYNIIQKKMTDFDENHRLKTQKGANDKFYSIKNYEPLEFETRFNELSNKYKQMIEFMKNAIKILHQTKYNKIKLDRTKYEEKEDYLKEIEKEHEDYKRWYANQLKMKVKLVKNVKNIDNLNKEKNEITVLNIDDSNVKEIEELVRIIIKNRDKEAEQSLSILQEVDVITSIPPQEIITANNLSEVIQRQKSVESDIQRITLSRRMSSKGSEKLPDGALIQSGSVGRNIPNDNEPAIMESVHENDLILEKLEEQIKELNGTEHTDKRKRLEEEIQEHFDRIPEEKLTPEQKIKKRSLLAKITNLFKRITTKIKNLFTKNKK
jgi:hypothetical protein